MGCQPIRCKEQTNVVRKLWTMAGRVYGYRGRMLALKCMADKQIKMPHRESPKRCEKDPQKNDGWQSDTPYRICRAILAKDPWNLCV